MCDDDLFCGINKSSAETVRDMPDLDKKHTPVIEAPDKVRKGEPFDVVVEVGNYLAHPNENGHYIEWIELYAGSTFLTRVDLIPRLTSPKVKFTLSLDHAHPLIARTRCNLHGLWESRGHDIAFE